MRYSTASFTNYFFTLTVNQALISLLEYCKVGASVVLRSMIKNFSSPASFLTEDTPYRNHGHSGVLTHSLTHAKCMTYDEHHNVVLF
jgi:hypothetical protein